MAGYQRGDLTGALTESTAKAAKARDAHTVAREKVIDALLAIAANGAYEDEDRLTVGDLRLAIYGKSGRPAGRNEVIDYTKSLVG
jgi:hypothetical protein